MQLVGTEAITLTRCGEVKPLEVGDMTVSMQDSALSMAELGTGAWEVEGMWSFESDAVPVPPAFWTLVACFLHHGKVPEVCPGQASAEAVHTLGSSPLLLCTLRNLNGTPGLQETLLGSQWSRLPSDFTDDT